LYVSLGVAWCLLVSLGDVPLHPGRLSRLVRLGTFPVIALHASNHAFKYFRVAYPLRPFGLSSFTCPSLCFPSIQSVLHHIT
jgi:hypothetical protein